MAALSGVRLRSSALILVLSGLTLVLGFAVQVVLAATLGTSREMDILLVALALPTLLATVSITVALSFLVPELTERLAMGGAVASSSLAAGAVRWSALIALLVACALGAFAAPIVGIVAPGLDPDAALSATTLLRIMLVGSFFDLLRGVLSAIQYSRERFLLPQLVPSFNHVLVIASALLLLKPFGLVGLAAGWSLGSLVMCVALLPALRGLGLLCARAGAPRAVPGLIGGRLLPILVAVALTQISPVVDRLVASLLPVGSISYLGYGSKMLEVLLRMVPMAVALGSFPVLSRLAAGGDQDRFRATTVAGLRWTLLGVVPLAFTVVVFRVQIVRLLFERGAFDAAATRNVAAVCAWYAAALVPAAVAYLLGYVFLAVKRLWFLAGVGAVSVALTAALDVAFAREWGFVGVALAFGAVSTVQVAILGGDLQRTRRLFSGARLLRFSAEIGGACAAMAGAWAAAWVLTNLWSERAPVVWLAVNIGAGLAVFILALWVLGNPDVRAAAGALSARLGRPRTGPRSEIG